MSKLVKRHRRLGKAVSNPMCGVAKSNISNLAFDTEMVEEDEAI
jgi:hypothetical protein